MQKVLTIWEMFCEEYIVSTANGWGGAVMFELEG